MGRSQTGIDVGGTFTDLASWDGTALHTAKVPTTPDDQSRGVVDALGSAPTRGSSLVHGTTVATNALLERAGAVTALVTDAGFEDLIEIGRQDRPSLYDVSRTRTTPLVAATHRLGLAGRDQHDQPGHLDAAAVAEVVTRLVALQPASVAVSTLFSFLHPDRERALRDALRDALPDVTVSISSSVAPEFREFERTSTTVINAYLMPMVARYLSRLGNAVAAVGVGGVPTVMRSSGGLIGLEEAARLPASIVLSGPAGGVVAAGAYGTALGKRSVISFDMGGTSTDVCRITDGLPQVSFERSIDGLPNRMPSVAIHTVGAGGGSVGWIDAGGALRVGPHSAGADPGPASYGRGGAAPTVTDADLLIGRLGNDGPLGLDAAAAHDVLRILGHRIGLDPLATARGIVEVVEAHMERAVRVVSVEEGADPRHSTLVAFGGAGAMHATALARRLDMAGVVVPPHAGVFSALGLLLAPPRADVVRGVLLAAGADLDAAVSGVMDAARRDLVATGSAVVDVTASADVRYRGQSHETPVGYAPGEGWDRLIERFHEAHRVRNGFARVDDPVEVVAVRAAAIGSPALSIDRLPAPTLSGVERRGERPALVEGESVSVPVWWRPALAVGAEVVGPAVIEEPEATTWLGSGERAVVDDLGAIEVEW
jgi:N-methylhydantoinase A